jgi:inorganic pyrophosphatase
MVHLWHDIPLGRNVPKRFPVVVEIPMRSKCKYELDKKIGIIKVDRVIASAVYYPWNYGFIPRTLAADDDPLDVLVVSQVAFAPGVFLEAIPIGGVHMIDNGKKDEKIICVAAKDPKFRPIVDLKQLSPNTRNEIEEFFRVYKNLEGKGVSINGTFGKKRAQQLIVSAHKCYKKKFGK